jgi:glycosyltransferase involved in cell wall biosynthesis
MRVTVLVPSTKYPRGGATALYEFANGLRRRGHEVCIVHVDFIGDWTDRAVVLDDPIERVEDVTWLEFEDGIEHLVGIGGKPELPEADAINYWAPGIPDHAGLPFLFLQGFGVLPGPLEERLFTAPCPKVCVASWLVREAERLGVPRRQLAHVACGVDHDKYRVVAEPADRPPQVALCYGSHHKRGDVALEALELVRARLPDTRAVLFGTSEPAAALPEWATYHRSPPQRVIVEEIYNGSRVFLNPSLIEGFGLPSVEAMACGCALVTVANGGSEDFAVDGTTAAVTKGHTAADLAAPVAELLGDDDRRLRLAAEGTRFVQRFGWDRSARELEGFLAAYVADPGAYV